MAGRDKGAPGWGCDRDRKGGCGVLGCPTFGGCDTPSPSSGEMPELAAPVALSTQVEAPGSAWHPAQGSPRPAGSPGSNGLLALVLQQGHQAVRGGGDTGSTGSAGSVAALCSSLQQQHHASSLLWGPWGAELPGPPPFPKSSFSVHAAQCKGLQLPPVATGHSSTAWGAVPHGGGPCSHSPLLPGAAAAGSAPSDGELWGAGATTARPNSPCPAALPDRPVVTLVVLGAAVAQPAPL